MRIGRQECICSWCAAPCERAAGRLAVRTIVGWRTLYTLCDRCIDRVRNSLLSATYEDSR